MVNLFRAEWQKIVGNRLAVGTLIWIFPIATLMLIVLYLVGVLLSPILRQQVAGAPSNWTQIVGYTWNIANNTFSQLVILAFTGIVFGGEYQWGMWKNLVYRRQRIHLVLMKFFTLGLFVALSFDTHGCQLHRHRCDVVAFHSRRCADRLSFCAGRDRHSTPAYPHRTAI
jgi:hypothetical protein